MTGDVILCGPATLAWLAASWTLLIPPAPHSGAEILLARPQLCSLGTMVNRRWPWVGSSQGYFGTKLFDRLHRGPGECFQ